jgi:hypothetical protein
MPAYRQVREESQMYAIIEVGSKQYSVKKDDIIEVNKEVVVRRYYGH